MFHIQHSNMWRIFTGNQLAFKKILCVTHWNRVSLLCPGCQVLPVFLDGPQTCHLCSFTEDICKITPSIITGFIPLCISICGKHKTFCISLSVKFPLHNIICEWNQAKYKWHHMLKGQGLLPHPTPSTRRIVKLMAVEIETVFARKTHDWVLHVLTSGHGHHTLIHHLHT
jgi:hypothetical protein